MTISGEYKRTWWGDAAEVLADGLAVTTPILFIAYQAGRMIAGSAGY